MTRRGMTLLEILVAMTVASIVTAAGVAAYQYLADAHQRRKVVLRRAVEQVEKRRQLAQWLAHAELPLLDEVVRFEGLQGLKQSDQLNFQTSMRTRVADNGTRIRLYVDTDPRTPELGLVADLSNRDGSKRTRESLFPEVRGLSIRYLSGVHAPRYWSSSWVSSTVLPAAVELRVAGERLPEALELPVLVPLRGAR